MFRFIKIKKSIENNHNKKDFTIFFTSKEKQEIKKLVNTLISEVGFKVTTLQASIFLSQKDALGKGFLPQNSRICEEG